MKTPHTLDDNLIDRTIETWQPRADRTLSREDGRQIIENVSGFFSILAEWSQAEAQETASAPDSGGDAS